MKKRRSLRLCVILHVFYTEMVDEIIGYLKNLEAVSDFDLYITTPPPQDKKYVEKFLKSFNKGVNVNIIYLENCPGGADIWPFIKVLNDINLDCYDIIFKLHTKRNITGGYRQRFGCGYKHKIYIGEDLWRNFLINEILGKDNVARLIKIFQTRKKAGALGFMPYILKFNSVMPGKVYINYVKKVPKSYTCYAGTIFAIRANILRAIQGLYKEEDFIKPPNSKFSQNAYIFEILFGNLVQAQGMKNMGVSLFSNPLIFELISHEKTFPVFKWYVNKFIFKKDFIKS